MPRFFLHLSYNGGAYHGWQKQPNEITVQETLEKALSVYTRQDVFLTGQGRTDAGVHATCFYAHWDFKEGEAWPWEANPEVWLARLNRMLPPDLALHAVIGVPDTLHARFSALSRTYRYRIHWTKDPFLAGRSWWLPAQPDWEAVISATKALPGTRDFGAFARSGGGQKHNFCELRRAEWTFPAPGEACLTLQANRFLRNMVRAVVGTLMEVGRGYREAHLMEQLIQEANRSAAGTSAPAHGLYLEQVEYPEGLLDQPLFGVAPPLLQP